MSDARQNISQDKWKKIDLFRLLCNAYPTGGSALQRSVELKQHEAALTFNSKCFIDRFQQTKR
jgi:hypothetical protein